MERAARQKRMVTVVLLASLREEVGGRKEVKVEAGDWREALRKLRDAFPGLKSVLNEKGEPEAGYLVFVDGVDYRLKEPGPAEKIVILPVNHGGGSPGKFLYVTWEEIEEASAELARKIVESGFKPDIIVGILRGGIIPARLLADELGVEEMGVMEVKLYKGVGVRREKPYLKQPLIADIFERNVLIVDDVSDTGLTLQLALNAISLYDPKSVRSATLFIKPWTRLVPNYYFKTTDKWVVFPWNKREVKREIEAGAGD